jgi:hypothetical protein
VPTPPFPRLLDPHCDKECAVSTISQQFTGTDSRDLQEASIVGGAPAYCSWLVREVQTRRKKNGIVRTQGINSRSSILLVRASVGEPARKQPCGWATHQPLPRIGHRATPTNSKAPSIRGLVVHIGRPLIEPSPPSSSPLSTLSLLCLRHALSSATVLNFAILHGKL